MRKHTHTQDRYTRDAAVRRLERVNRWLLAGSVALTGALAEVAAHAFPGRTLASAQARTTSGTRSHRDSHRASSARPLRAPSQPPQAAPQPASSTPAQEAPPEQESAPASEPAQESSPVISGGS